MSVTRSEIKSASVRILPFIQRTPIMTSDNFGLGYPIDLKLEHLQLSGSFKARGAFNNLLAREVPATGIVAASGGNHGAAVAMAAKRLGVRARVYVPELAGSEKISLIKRSGADLVVVPGDYSQAFLAAEAYENETGAMQIHAYDRPETVAGQGTLALEWEEQGMKADTIMIAVGGGGLISGAFAWFQGNRKIVAVEPERAPTLHRALKNGPETEVEVSGVAANALGARKIGRICYDLAQAQNAESLLVSDAAIMDAQKLLWQSHRLLVEPAGATALAALSSGAYRPQPNERVAVLLCGGNVASDPLIAAG